MQEFFENLDLENQNNQNNQEHTDTNEMLGCDIWYN